MDAEAIRKRLLSRSFVLFPEDMSLDRCAKTALNLLSESEQGCKPALATLEKEIDLVLIEYRKSKRARQQHDREVQEYQKLSDDVATKVNENVRDIEILRKQLKEERTMRQRKEECEEVAKSVHQVQSRSQTQKEITKLSDELSELNRIRKETEEEFVLRKKQFQLLMHSISSLKEEMKQDQA
mmetsp:Transcript_16301/g.18456  ORF Transcript_16301/g.18456 Transcript_16301/m.18456 type:complete len:183 (+) Transcript_16301:155-703(+)|eukprot:CAMPEP_0184013294 /NCGR_PEP_ID=MMETSP0954-20121128/4929_1 /TAXON_ID=627963 /ORGANISM="Aplanochytrium sp, Strain PBS07" /LENGTH=182 /DNA_ID=CAMNT_0026293459 /DNA_START=161 /DNA_END=709 /DNA_ORIENTATION=-